MKKAETGRSMVEMLGVLAIIGVLSVGGIAAYTTAMNKHRANEILNRASMLVPQARAANVGEGGCVELVSPGGSTNFTNVAGVDVDIVASYVKDLDEVQVHILISDSDMCRKLKPHIDGNSSNDVTIGLESCENPPSSIDCV